MSNLKSNPDVDNEVSVIGESGGSSSKSSNRSGVTRSSTSDRTAKGLTRSSSGDRNKNSLTRSSVANRTAPTRSYN